MMSLWLQNKHVIHLISLVFILACFAGLAYQILLVSQLFFSYRTTTAITIKIPMTINPQTATICSRFVDHLDYERIRRDNPRRKTWDQTVDPDMMRKYQHDLFIDEIFKYTPDPKTTLSKVIFRENHSYTNMEFQGQQVYNHFGVDRFIYLEYVCYEFNPRKPVFISYSTLSVTPVSSGQVFELTFNTTLEKASVLKITLHSEGSVPYRALKVSPQLRRNWNQHHQSNVYSTFSKILKIYNLPPPYDTDCFPYRKLGLTSAMHCVQNCVRKKVVKQLGKVPFSAIIQRSVHKRIVSYLDVSQPNISQKLFEIEKVCLSGNCRHKSCYDFTSLTETTETAGPEFVFRRIVPSDPFISVKVSPALNIVEYLTYVLSAISIWTGLSVISLNPANLWKLFTARKRRRRFIKHRPI